MGKKDAKGQKKWVARGEGNSIRHGEESKVGRDWQKRGGTVRVGCLPHNHAGGKIKVYRPRGKRVSAIPNAVKGTRKRAESAEEKLKNARSPKVKVKGKVDTKRSGAGSALKCSRGGEGQMKV